MMSAQQTVAVLGGGSAGFTAARTAAQLGARVVFFMGDNADMASLCVNRGCMPSKAMFEPIDAMHHARRQGLLRIEPLRPEAHLAQIVAWKDREIARFRAYRQSAIAACESESFVIVRANARFVDEHTLEAEGRTYSFDRAIIATGSVPRRPAIDGLSEPRARSGPTTTFSPTPYCPSRLCSSAPAPSGWSSRCATRGSEAR